jgi:hypothetical protein
MKPFRKLYPTKAPAPPKARFFKVNALLKPLAMLSPISSIFLFVSPDLSDFSAGSGVIGDDTSSNCSLVDAASAASTARPICFCIRVVCSITLVLIL